MHLRHSTPERSHTYAALGVISNNCQTIFCAFAVIDAFCLRKMISHTKNRFLNSAQISDLPFFRSAFLWGSFGLFTNEWILYTRNIVCIFTATRYNFTRRREDNCFRQNNENSETKAVPNQFTLSPNERV